jgi:hypothetical protein
VPTQLCDLYKTKINTGGSEGQELLKKFYLPLLIRDYGLLAYDTIQPGKYISIFEGTCCIYIQGRRIQSKDGDVAFTVF